MINDHWSWSGGGLAWSCMRWWLGGFLSTTGMFLPFVHHHHHSCHRHQSSFNSWCFAGTMTSCLSWSWWKTFGSRRRSAARRKTSSQSFWSKPQQTGLVEDLRMQSEHFKYFSFLKSTLIFCRTVKTNITFTFCCRAVKTHPFFNSINWSDLDKKRVTPPFKPQVWTKKYWRNSLLRVFARFPTIWSLFRLSQTLTLATLTLSSLVSSKSFHRHCRCLFCTVLFMMIVMMATRWECRADATWPRLLPPDPKHLRGAGGGGPGLLQPGQQSQNGAYSAALHPFKMAFFIFGQIKNLTITTNILSVFVSRPQFCDGRGKSHVWKLIKVSFSDWRFWSSMSLFQIVWCSELGNRNPNNMESIFSLTKEAGFKTMEGSQM